MPISPNQSNIIENDIFDKLSDDARQLNEVISDMVESRKSLKERHRIELEKFDRNMLTFLWRCRPLLSTVVIARMVNLSRQRLYEKWTRFGFDTSEDISK